MEKFGIIILNSFMDLACSFAFSFIHGPYHLLRLHASHAHRDTEIFELPCYTSCDDCPALMFYDLLFSDSKLAGSIH